MTESGTTTVRVILPVHLRRLAGLSGSETVVSVTDPVTIGAAIDAVEAAHPVLSGAIRDRATGRRRAFVRYFACQQDLSHAPVDELLPAEIVEGREPLLIVGAMAGG